MEIRWRNIFALFLVIVLLAICWKAAPEIRMLLGSLRDVGPGSPRGRETGLMAFGLICILIVAIVKILVGRN